MSDIPKAGASQNQNIDRHQNKHPIKEIPGASKVSSVMSGKTSTAKGDAKGDASGDARGTARGHITTGQLKPQTEQPQITSSSLIMGVLNNLKTLKNEGDSTIDRAAKMTHEEIALKEKLQENFATISSEITTDLLHLSELKNEDSSTEDISRAAELSMIIQEKEAKITNTIFELAEAILNVNRGDLSKEQLQTISDQLDELLSNSEISGILEEKVEGFITDQYDEEPTPSPTLKDLLVEANRHIGVLLTPDRLRWGQKT